MPVAYSPGKITPRPRLHHRHCLVLPAQPCLCVAAAHALLRLCLSMLAGLQAASCTMAWL